MTHTVFVSFHVWLIVDAIEVFYTCKSLYFTDKLYIDDYGESSPLQPDSPCANVASHDDTGNF